MRTLPIDTSKMTVLVGGAIAAATSDDGTPRRDRNGAVLFNIPAVVLIEGGNAETLTVRVPGPVPQLAPMTPVRLLNLVARPWSMEGRSGVSFSADALQPVASATAPKS